MQCIIVEICHQFFVDSNQANQAGTYPQTTPIGAAKIYEGNLR